MTPYDSANPSRSACFLNDFGLFQLLGSASRLSIKECIHAYVVLLAVIVLEAMQKSQSDANKLAQAEAEKQHLGQRNGLESTRITVLARYNNVLLCLGHKKFYITIQIE